MRWKIMISALLLAVSAAAGEAPARVASRLDELVQAKWRQASARPAEAASDEELLRRLYLDLVGRVPTSEEARAFLESRDPNKREVLVATLTGSPDFSSYWARRLGILLLGRGRLPRQIDRSAFEAWLEESLATEKPYDRMVREILTASGNPVDRPEVNYLLRFEMKAEDVAESVSASFLGVQIGCARCHDHPYERWTQEDFFGMAAAFSGLTLERPTRADRRARREFRQKRESIQQSREDMSPEERRKMRESMEGDAEALRRTVRLTDAPGKKLEVEIDGATRSFSAQFLDGTRAPGTPREALADWVLGPGNPYFSRSAVNRVWEAFFGRGLVDPVDAFGDVNPPSHPEALDLLARDFRESGYDLRRLMSVLALSETYQRSSRYPGELPAPELFAVARPRRMSPEQLFESLVTVAGVSEHARFQERKDEFLRAFVFLFETDAVDDVELAQGTIPQSLFFLNGRMTNQTLGAGARGLGADPVEELFLRALSRYPTAEEKGAIAAAVGRSPSRVEGAMDVLWALVNTSEFVLVH